MAAGTSNRNPSDRNAEATVHIAYLDDKVTDAILWELMVQAGPVTHVYIPRNRITGAHYGYGFCEFRTALDALYATKVLNMVRLFDKTIRISQSTIDKVSQDVGANLFIGNLVDEVDDKLLHDAFSAFGPLIDAPYIMRTNNLPSTDARRYGFVKYAAFEHADAAIAAMNGQYICNHPITVQYAFKKDSDSRERHGSHAERQLAARAAQNANASSLADRLTPNTFFADAPPKRKRPAHSPSPPPPQPAPPAHMSAPPSHLPHPKPHPNPPHPIHPHYQAYPPHTPAPAPPTYPSVHYHSSVPPRRGWYQQQPHVQPHVQPPYPSIHPAQGFPPYGAPPQQVQIGWSRNRAPVPRPHGQTLPPYGRPPPAADPARGAHPTPNDSSSVQHSGVQHPSGSSNRK